MKHSVLKIHPADNVLVALRDIKQGETIQFKEDVFLLKNDVPAKHKFTTTNLQKGDVITMYGITVGKAVQDIERGSLI